MTLLIPNKDLKIHKHVPLAPLSTLEIGGTARYFVRAECEDDVAQAVRFAGSNDLDLFILGGGSNVLFSDQGFDGMVLQIKLTGVTSDEQAVSHPLVSASAGEDWDGFVAYCVRHQLAGVECLSGIPGFVGGTPVQNVGAYGQEVADSIVEVRCFDRITREFVTLSNADCGFRYRTSVFNSTHRDRYIVLRVTFALIKNGKPKLVYKELSEYLTGQTPSLLDVREAVLAIRKRKSMVIDSADPNSKSAGSFFKNPVVEREKLREIETGFEQVPHFEFGDKVKIPAAWLIENAGFVKGYSLNKAGISSNHTLAVINRGGASSADIILLKEKIQNAVADKFGIELSPEPVFVGF